MINSHILFKDYFGLVRGNSNFELIDYITNLMNELRNQTNNVQAVQISNNRRRSILDKEKIDYQVYILHLKSVLN